ncbi:Uncharacterised protein [Sphingobacterium spiritivorum]|uniref:Uncharacterized protein n=1 Tax=Sphingobacterium spiritivorum TaxID=258 RepID=A0A380BTU8_SPHSI|nr:hypothetical protein [Sphingobacterium spiritivorum]SUJ05871.1 Uncharacterised protein [Sphingobacterium spiritivorum]
MNKKAAVLVRDAEAGEKLITTALQLLNDAERSAELSTNIKKLALLDADDVIAKQVIEIAK